MNAHTPGPWEVDVDGTGWAIGPSDRFVATIDIDHTIDENDTPLSDAECEANARLIAAAPDLLEALRFMLDAYVEDPWEANRSAAEEAARDAIARALGEA